MCNSNKYVEILKEICKRIEPGKKMLQKLMYLIERRGVELDLNYSIHFFGPYSSKLDRTVHILESKDVVRIDTHGMTHKINMGKVQIESNELTKEEFEKVDFVLDKFISSTALELEAITTLDYVATKLLKNIDSDEKIIEGVKTIKGTKFKEDYLKKQLKILKEYEYLS